MKRTSLIVVFLALLAASGFFPGAHTASANELTYEAGTAIEPLSLPDDATLHELGGEPRLIPSACWGFPLAYRMTRPRG